MFDLILLPQGTMFGTGGASIGFVLFPQGSQFDDVRASAPLAPLGITSSLTFGLPTISALPGPSAARRNISVSAVLL